MGLGLLEIVRPERSPVAYQRRHIYIRYLVYQFQNQALTDPRDHIYAFFGIATDIQNTQLRADYNVSTAFVCAKFAEVLLSRNKARDRPLRLLSACYRNSQEIHDKKIRTELL
jgi:hypothetical protein